MNFWKRYPADYQRKTARLSLQEHGAYTLLLDEQYTTEKPLPTEIGKLFRICRAMKKSEKDAVRSVADHYFPLGPDGLRVNKRAVEELEEAAPAVQAARANGKKGGRPKKPTGIPTGQPTGIPTGFSGNNPAETQQKPSSKAPHSSDLREEKEKPPAGVQGGKASKRCPDSFVVTAELVAWAKEHAPGVDVPRETVKLRNHEFAKAKSDWPATWRNWILEGFERMRPSGGGNAKSFRERDEQLAADKHRRWTSSGPAAQAGEVIDMETPHGTRIANG